MTSEFHPASRRRVRSFVRRAGRVTAAQRRALEQYWPEYGIDYAPRLLDFAAEFGREAPRILEIGFGDGQLLADRAARSPECDFIGIEVHEPGVGHCLLAVRHARLANVRIIRHDAIEVLQHQVPDGALAEVDLFFPDPWPKKRHHKRRIVQPLFVELVARKLACGGLFHTATDWAPYAAHIREILAQSTLFEPVAAPPAERPKTRFERRGERLGHAVWEQVYRRSADVPIAREMSYK